MSDENEEMVPLAEVRRLHSKLRELKHDISNSLAVMMALAEMTQRRPEHAEKLCRAVLNKAPKIVEEMHEFVMEFRQMAKPPADDNPLIRE